MRSSQELPLRVVPLVVTVTAPAGSRLAARTGAGDVVVTGRAGWAAVRTGSGEVDVAAVDGDTDVTTGSGDLVLGEVTGRARLRTGSGTIRLTAAGGPTEIKAGSGDVALGAVSGDLGVRTGSGEVRIDDARSGRFDLTTGSGELRVAVHPGVRAELDLTSGSGRARSDLAVNAAPPARGRGPAGARAHRQRRRAGDPRDRARLTPTSGPRDAIRCTHRRLGCCCRAVPHHITRAIDAVAPVVRDMAAARGAAMSPRARPAPRRSPSHSAIAAQLGRQLGGHPGAFDSGLGERALHPQHARGAVGLEVDPGHQLAVEQEREHVVAVLALRLGHVDLDAVAEAEDPLGAGALPDQRVERAQQRPPGDPPRDAGAGHPVGGRPPAPHRDRLQLAGLHQLGHGLLARAGPSR